MMSAQAVKSALADQLHAIRKLLRKAAKHASEDVEYVHQLRVATRRMTEALRIYAPLLPEDEHDWLRRQLRKIRHAADEARDCDVMGERLAERQIDKRVQKIRRRHRRRAQSPIVRLSARLRPELKRRSKRIVRRISSDELETFERYRADILSARVEAFVAASSPATNDLEALHRFRIEAKKLRYALELVGGAEVAEAVGRLKSLQRWLGEIHDHVMAIERMARWRGQERKRRRRLALGEAIADEERQLAAACRGFVRWWTPERRAELCGELRKAVSKATSYPPAERRTTTST